MCAFLDIEGAFVITSHAECLNFQGSQELSGLLDHTSIVMKIIGSCPQVGVVLEVLINTVQSNADDIVLICLNNYVTESISD